MTNRPSGPVILARTEPYPVRFLTAWLLACSIPAMAIICVKAIQRVRADNRVIAPASDKNHVSTYCRDAEYVRDGKVYPEVRR